MRSLRDADATARQWARSKRMVHESNASNGQLAFMVQKLNRQRRRVVGGGGSTPSSGMVFKGEYSGAAYDSQNVVSFQPDGQSPGLYLALKAVPAGQSPDIGAPYWMAFPVPSPGMWGV